VNTEQRMQDLSFTDLPDDLFNLFQKAISFHQSKQEVRTCALLSIIERCCSLRGITIKRCYPTYGYRNLSINRGIKFNKLI
jgi:hypothetical protein